MILFVKLSFTFCFTAINSTIRQYFLHNLMFYCVRRSSFAYVIFKHNNARYSTFYLNAYSLVKKSEKSCRQQNLVVCYHRTVIVAKQKCQKIDFC